MGWGPPPEPCRADTTQNLHYASNAGTSRRPEIWSPGSEQKWWETWDLFMYTDILRAVRCMFSWWDVIVNQWPPDCVGTDPNTTDSRVNYCWLSNWSGCVHMVTKWFSFVLHADSLWDCFLNSSWTVDGFISSLAFEFMLKPHHKALWVLQGPSPTTKELHQSPSGTGLLKRSRYHPPRI